MSFSFCLNKNHVLTMAGFGLLFQTIDFDRRGKLIQDSERLLCSVAFILERNGAPGAGEFKKTTCSMISVHPGTQTARPTLEESVMRRRSDPTMPAPKSTPKLLRKFQAPASRSASSSSSQVKKEVSSGRRFTAPTLPTPLLPGHNRKSSQNSIRSVASEPFNKRSLAHGVPLCGPSEPLDLPNLDYLDFGNEPATASYDTSPSIVQSPATMIEMEKCGFKTDDAHQQPLDMMYPKTDVFSYIADSPSTSNTFDWCSDVWTMPTDMNNQTAQSNFSEEELTSGEEMSSCGTSGHFGVESLPKENGAISLDRMDGVFGL